MPTLFSGKSHVEIVFLTRPYLGNTNDLSCPLSISFNALICLQWKFFPFVVTLFLHCFKYETPNISDKPQNI